MNAINSFGQFSKNADYSVDKSDLRQIILDSPKQLRWVADNWKPIKFDKKFSNVILCGIGGSAWPMEFVTNYLDANQSAWLNEVPITINRSYDLPDEANENSLIIFSSYSGNTEEPLMSYDAIIKKGLNGVAISSGGKLEELAAENNTYFIKIPDSAIPPRLSTGYIVSFLLKILSDAEIIKDVTKEMFEARKYLEELTANADFEEKGCRLAEKINNRIPVIYSSVNYKIASKVWKIAINENSKIPAFWNYIPEVDHNEMAGFTKAKRDEFFIIILKDKEDNKTLLRVMDISADILKKEKIACEVVEITGSNYLSKIFSTTLLGDWVSYYLAVLNGIDPTPIEVISEFKQELEEKNK